MKRIFRILFFVLILPVFSNGQGIRLEWFGVKSLAADYAQPNFYGFGYEHNVGEKISLGLTYRAGYDISGDGPSQSQINYTSTVYGDVYFYLYQSTNWHEFSYSSKYYFEDNEDGSFYFSNTISMFKAENVYDVTEIYSNSGSTGGGFDGIPIGETKQKVTLIPLSFDLGYRSEFDGWYQDYYIGATFLPFGNLKAVQPSGLASHGVKPLFSSVSFQLGLCMGISWK